MSPSAVAAGVEMLLNHTDLRLENLDRLMLQLARKAGHLPLGTFDRGLAKVNGAQGL